MTVMVCMNHNAIFVDNKWYYVAYDAFDVLSENKIDFILSPSCDKCKSRR